MRRHVPQDPPAKHKYNDEVNHIRGFQSRYSADIISPQLNRWSLSEILFGKWNRQHEPADGKEQLNAVGSRSECNRDDRLRQALIWCRSEVERAYLPNMVGDDAHDCQKPKTVDLRNV